MKKSKRQLFNIVVERVRNGDFNGAEGIVIGFVKCLWCEVMTMHAHMIP